MCLCSGFFDENISRHRLHACMNPGGGVEFAAERAKTDYALWPGADAPCSLQASPSVTGKRVAHHLGP